MPLAIAAFTGLLALLIAYYFNRLVTDRNQVNEAWSDIDVQLKRRHDLIPNLIETVKEYAAHEKETLERVAEARTEAIRAGNLAQRVEAESNLGGAVKTLFAVAERYPDLKANQSF